MEHQHRTLAQIINRSDRVESSTSHSAQQVSSFNAYLTLFSINLAHRFPEVQNLEMINCHDVKLVADFSVACAFVAVQSWNEIAPTLISQNVEQPGFQRQQQRVAS